MLRGKGILSAGQKQILLDVSKIQDIDKFYLTGETALSEFYLGHRKSYDLDLFTSHKEIVLPFSRVIEETLKKNYEVQVVKRFESYVTFDIGVYSEKVKVELVYDSPFRFAQPEESDLGMRVTDFENLCVDKLLAFYGRAETRDTVDLYFILNVKTFGN